MIPVVTRKRKSAAASLVGRADEPSGAVPTRARYLLGYLIFVLAPTATAVVVLHVVGQDSGGSVPRSTDIAPLPPVDNLLSRALLACVLLMAVAHVGGLIAARLGQPRVIGELSAGFFVGPTALGALAPDLYAALFPAGLVPVLETLAQIGVVLFMFLVGLEVPHLRGTGKAAALLGGSGIAVCFLAGLLTALAWPVAGRPAGVPTATFVMFIGVVLAVTAFPVLARIIRDRGLSGTSVGALAMATAGLTDVVVWSLLALVTAGRGAPGLTMARTVGLTAAFAAVMWFAVRPLLARLMSRYGDRPSIRLGLLFLVLVSALITDLIGVHPIFGAFLAGLIVPRDRTPVVEFAHQIEGFTSWLLLPLFFATVGLRIDLGILGGDFGWVLAMVGVATASKLVATALPSLLVGMSTRDAVGLGVMMNCRGLTELVVLKIGLTAGLLTPQLFAILVTMCLVTTALTGPVLSAMQRFTGWHPTGRADEITDHRLLDTGVGLATRS